MIANIRLVRLILEIVKTCGWVPVLIPRQCVDGADRRFVINLFDACAFWQLGRDDRRGSETSADG